MNEKRRFSRVRYNAKCSLTHNNITYMGQLENISSNGALISFNDGIVIPNYDRCNLNIYIEDQSAPLRIEIEVIYSNFTMLGVRFANDEKLVKDALGNLLERLTSGKDNSVNEQQLFCGEGEG
jgi:hypothetical protein